MILGFQKSLLTMQKLLVGEETTKSRWPHVDLHQSPTKRRVRIRVFSSRKNMLREEYYIVTVVKITHE